MKGVFIAGTDTGVGKTLAAAGLLLALGQRHERVVGMKPVAAGAIRVGDEGASEDALALRAASSIRVGDEWTSEDALALRAASSIRVPADLDNPVLLPEPLSPHLAARRAGTRIDIGHVVHCYRQLAERADAVVVEGAGGFLVPLGDRETGADLAQALGLPVVLVVGLRLGCLNHALLTAEAIRARGLTLAGWICNRIDPDMLQPEDNVDYLRTQLAAPLLADIAFRAAPDPRDVHFHLPADWP